MNPALAALLRVPVVVAAAALALATVVVPAAAAPSANPAAGALPVSTTLPTLAKTLFIHGWMTSCDRYERMEHAVVLKGPRAPLRATTCNFTAGGAPVPFGVNTTLTLTLDGHAVATAPIRAGDVTVTFDVDLSALAEGWYMASITGLDNSWAVLDYGVYVLRGTTAQPHGWMPVTTASHELMFEGGGRYQRTWVPARFEPVTVPYPAREFPALPVVPRRKDVVMTSLAVPRPGDLYRPALTKEGVWTTANRENYFYFDFEQAKPILPMLDGPRGRGSIISPVHLEVGNAAPNGVLRGNVYFVESWRIGKVTPDGTVVTLAGYRHRDMASYWADPTSAELVGDWSSIPVERRGFAQPWGMAWDPRTLTINEQAAPIPTEGNERPHVLAPVMYISDTFRNRIVKIEFSAVAHGVPPRVTEFVTGLNEPWDVIAVGTQLYVSDRKNNAIKVFDMDTAALVRTIPVVQPEGMALLDGWLYYSSVRSKSIRKINLATGADVLISDPSVPGSNMGYYINGNSRFMKIAVSDGTFGPRGMIAFTTWSNSYYGYPNLIDGATGKMIDWLNVASGETVKGTSPLGLSSYPSAVGIGHGRMLFGTAEEGLHVVSKALPTDPVINAATYRAGKDQWQARGLGLTHGPGGYGYYGLPLPWGQTPEIDYFLRANLHGAGLPASGNAPNVGTSASSLAFGNVAVGQTSPAQTITVTNVGTADATNMSYPAAPPKFVRGGTCSGTTLATGASCTITFAYAPTVATTDTATYTIAGGGSTRSIALSGTGTGAGSPPAAAASLSASPSSLAFGTVAVSLTSTTTVTVRNTGSGAATGVSVTSSNPARFPLATNACGASLAAGASCSVSVGYAPAAASADSANLTIAYAGGTPVVVAMSGTGASAPTAGLTARPALVDFGEVIVGRTSSAVVVTVTNAGAAAATGLSVRNGNSAQFPLSANTCGTSIGAGASCTFAVAFAPWIPGADSASITIGYAGGGAVVVPLSGRGVGGAQPQGAGQLTFETAVTLPSTAVGATSALRTVTITNTGSTAVTVTGVTSGSSEFAVASNSCGSLAAGGTCSFAVAFAPSTAGARSGVITVSSDATGSPRRSLGAFGNGVSAGATVQSGSSTAAVEYHHQAFDHYFVTATEDEIAKLDGGQFPGWSRTDGRFNVYTSAAVGRETVCRFFSAAFGARSSHFYTPDAAECAMARANEHWQFEGGVFYAVPPALDGSCPEGTNPVYRVYNNGRGGAPNHRYMSDNAERARMLQLGWIAEGFGATGVVMCAPR